MRILGPQTAWCGGYCASEIHWIDCETECSSFANALQELLPETWFHRCLEHVKRDIKKEASKMVDKMAHS